MRKKTDLRRLTHEELTEFRKQAVSLVQSGVPVRVVCEGMGVSRAALFGWLARYRAGGWDALRARKRGGRRPKLDGRQLAWVYEVVTGRDPRQLKFPFALWTVKMVRELIEREFGVKLSRMSVWRLLRQMGLTPQRPLVRASQQDAEVFIGFLKRLLHDSGRPVFLVLDNHPVHRSRAVRAFVEAQEGRLELHFLPPYSPELNPVEQVWRHAKSHQIGKKVIEGPEHLKRLVISALRRLQKLPHIIRGFFRHPECAYTLQ